MLQGQENHDIKKIVKHWSGVNIENGDGAARGLSTTMGANEKSGK